MHRIRFRLAFLLAVAALVACAHGTDGARQGIAGAERTASTVVRSWHELNRVQQMAIARRGLESGDRAGAAAELARWRVVVDQVHLAIAAFDAADAVAHVAVAMVEQGGKVDLVPIAADLVRAGVELGRAIEAARAAAAGGNTNDGGTR